jgi:hypothetical protein
MQGVSRKGIAIAYDKATQQGRDIRNYGGLERLGLRQCKSAGRRKIGNQASWDNRLRRDTKRGSL